MFRTKSNLSISTESDDEQELELSMGTTQSKRIYDYAKKRKEAIAKALKIRKQRTKKSEHQSDYETKSSQPQKFKMFPACDLSIIWFYVFLFLSNNFLTWEEHVNMRTVCKLFLKFADPLPTYNIVPSSIAPTFDLAIQFARRIYKERGIILTLCLQNGKHKTHDGKHKWSRGYGSSPPKLLTNDLKLDFPVRIRGGGTKCLIFGGIVIKTNNVMLDNFVVVGSTTCGIKIINLAKNDLTVLEVFFVEVTRAKESGFYLYNIDTNSTGKFINCIASKCKTGLVLAEHDWGRLDNDWTSFFKKNSFALIGNKIEKKKLFESIRCV